MMPIPLLMISCTVNWNISLKMEKGPAGFSSGKGICFNANEAVEIYSGPARREEPINIMSKHNLVVAGFHSPV
jgi:hypothetical protein